MSYADIMPVKKIFYFRETGTTANVLHSSADTRMEKSNPNVDIEVRVTVNCIRTLPTKDVA